MISFALCYLLCHLFAVFLLGRYGNGSSSRFKDGKIELVELFGFSRVLGVPRGPDDWFGFFLLEIDNGYCFTVLCLMVEILLVLSVFV